MKRFTWIMAMLGAAAIVTGAAMRIASVAIAGWVVTMLFSVWHLECCNRNQVQRAQKRADDLQRMHENALDTYQFSTTLTRERLMREYEKMEL